MSPIMPMLLRPGEEAAVAVYAQSQRRRQRCGQLHLLLLLLLLLQVLGRCDRSTNTVSPSSLAGR